MYGVSAVLVVLSCLVACHPVKVLSAAQQCGIKLNGSDGGSIITCTFGGQVVGNNQRYLLEHHIAASDDV